MEFIGDEKSSTVLVQQAIPSPPRRLGTRRGASHRPSYIDLWSSALDYIYSTARATASSDRGSKEMEGEMEFESDGNIYTCVK